MSVADNATILFSYVGYITQELSARKAGGTILLKEYQQVLDEVVVVGFGTQKKINLTGFVATATAKDFEARPVANAV